jgi:acetyl-CoA carboxylase biotin carboxylase subunit
MDTHVCDGYRMPSQYDSLLGKLIVHRESREAAITAMSAALEELLIEGVATTTPFHLEILKRTDFLQATAHTGSIEEERIGTRRRTRRS